MADLALIDGDLSDGSLIYEGGDVAQRCTIALQKFLGEWLLDTSAGCDWLREPRLTDVAAAGIALRAVSKVDGVSTAQVQSVVVSPDRSVTITMHINGERLKVNV